MSNTIDPKHYDKTALKGMFYLKGHEHFLSVAADYLGVGEKQAAAKLRTGCMSHEDTILLAKGLEMTPRQYINVFMRGVFDID